MKAITGKQEQCIRQAIEAGAERLADLDTISFLFDGDTVAVLRRADAEPAQDAKDWITWANAVGADWSFVAASPAEAAPILRRSMEREIERAKSQYDLRLNHVRFRAASPPIPMDKGGLEALIESDRPS